MTSDAPTAAERFRDAVGRRDIAGMINTMAPEIELHSPTALRPVIGRERVRAVLHILNELRNGEELSSGVSSARTSPRQGSVNGALVGERWQVGDAGVLEVTSRRIPCRTFAGWLEEQLSFPDPASPGTPTRAGSASRLRDRRKTG